MKRLIFSIIALVAISAQLFAENNPYRDDYQWTIIPDHTDWLYKTGEKASLKVILTRAGVPIDGKISYYIENDMLPTDIKGEAQLKRGETTLNIGTLKNPGFRSTILNFVDDRGVSHKFRIKVGFDVDRIKPLTRMPADFDAFWEKARKEVETPLVYTSERVDEMCDEVSECYLVKLQTVGKHCVYGYMYIPKGAKPGSCPMMITPPGAGIKGLKAHKKDASCEYGIARFEFEIHGLYPSWDGDEIYQPIYNAFCTEVPHMYNAINVGDRDHYYMRHVYQSLIKAIDFVTSLPEWDGKNVYSYGGSQGGGLTLVAAGLDSRITACVAKYPAMVEMGGYSRPGQMGGWPHFKEPQFTTENVVKSLEYYDVINFTRKIKVPTMLIFGYNDNVCPPTTSYMVWNTLDCEKKLWLMPFAEHWSSPEANIALYTWLSTEQIAK